MAGKRRHEEEEEQIMLADPEDADVDVLMASPGAEDAQLHLDTDEVLATNAANAAGVLDEPSKRPALPMSNDLGAIASAPKKKKDEWMRKAAGDLKMPLMRVKRIVRTDKDIKQANPAAWILLAKATVMIKNFIFPEIKQEMFLETLVVEAHKKTAAEKRKTLQYKDIAGAIADIDAMEFLSGSSLLSLCSSD